MAQSKNRIILDIPKNTEADSLWIDCDVYGPNHIGLAMIPVKGTIIVTLDRHSDGATSLNVLRGEIGMAVLPINTNVRALRQLLADGQLDDEIITVMDSDERQDTDAIEHKVNDLLMRWPSVWSPGEYLNDSSLDDLGLTPCSEDNEVIAKAVELYSARPGDVVLAGGVVGLIEYLHTWIEGEDRDDCNSSQDD